MTGWNEFIAYVQSLPEGAQGYALGAVVTIIGVLLGSVFTLFGVISTNRTNQENIRVQLRHDEASRAREHALGLRKQIYLEMAEVFALGLRSLLNLQNLNTPVEEVFKDYFSQSPKLAQIHVVASEDTAICISRFAHAINASYFELRLARKDLDELHSQIQQQAKGREYHSAVQKEMLEIFQKERIAGVATSNRVSDLFEKIDKELEFATKYAAKESELHEELRPAHLAYCQRCVAENVRLARSSIEVIASVRKDLGMPIDEKKYAQALEPTPGNDDALSRIFEMPVEGTVGQRVI